MTLLLMSANFTFSLQPVSIEVDLVVLVFPPPAAQADLMRLLGLEDLVPQQSVAVKKVVLAAPEVAMKKTVASVPVVPVGREVLAST